MGFDTRLQTAVFGGQTAVLRRHFRCASSASLAWDARPTGGGETSGGSVRRKDGGPRRGGPAGPAGQAGPHTRVGADPVLAGPAQSGQPRPRLPGLGHRCQTQPHRISPGLHTQISIPHCDRKPKVQFGIVPHASEDAVDTDGVVEGDGAAGLARDPPTLPSPPRPELQQKLHTPL